MKVTWIGQAGLLFEGRGITVMVDPYLSDSVGKRSPKKQFLVYIADFPSKKKGNQIQTLC